MSDRSRPATRLAPLVAAVGAALSDEQFRPYSYRHAFMRADIPAFSKLVLHTIAAHFGESGEPVFPRIDTIARRASMSRRAALKHLALVRDVWVDVRKGYVQEKDGTWRAANFYLPRYPDGLINFEESSSFSGAPRARAPRAPAIRHKSSLVLNSSPNPNTDVLGDELKAWFNTEFWPRYPRKRGKHTALAALRELQPSTTEREAILAALEKLERRGGAVSSASRWLASAPWRPRMEPSCCFCGATPAASSCSAGWHCRAEACRDRALFETRPR